MANGTDHEWSDALKEVQAKAVALDERRMAQINRQTVSINLLMQRIQAWEAFCDEVGMLEEAEKFVNEQLASRETEGDE